MSRKKKSATTKTTTTTEEPPNSKRSVKHSAEVEHQQRDEEQPASESGNSTSEGVETSSAESSVQAEKDEIEKQPRPPREFIMAIESENLRMFRKAVSSLGLMTEEARFHVDAKEIRFIGMDPAHVSLIDFSWKREACKEYVADGEFDLTLRLEDLLRRLPKEYGASVIITQNPELSTKQTVSLRKTLGGRTTAFEIPELESQIAKRLPLPKLEWQVRAILNANSLLEILEKDIAQVTNKVSLIATPEGLELFDRGDTGPVSTILTRGSPEMISLDFNQGETSKPIAEYPIISRYSLEYLIKILRALKADNVVLEYSRKAPLKLGYELPNNSYLNFMLAPVVQEAEHNEKTHSAQQSTEEASDQTAEGNQAEGSENNSPNVEATADADVEGQKPSSSRGNLIENLKKKAESWTKEKVVRSVQNILKNRSIEYLSESAYYFFHMYCGSIAHYNRVGWAAQYKDLRDFLNFFLEKNEYGQCLEDPPQFMNLSKEQRETILEVVSMCKQYRVQIFVELDQRDLELSKEIGRGPVNGEISIKEILDPENAIQIIENQQKKVGTSKPTFRKKRADN